VASASLETDIRQPESRIIGITLHPDGARKFGDITATNIGRQLAIVWRGRVLSAPVIRSAISNGVISITGNWSEAEGRVLHQLLNFKPGQAATARHPAHQATLVEQPPILRFVAWEDEWKTNRPGAARHPDGTPVTDVTELQWLRTVNDGGMSAVFESQPRFLKLWFSHPEFQRTDFIEVSLRDDHGHYLKLGADGSSSCSLVDASQKTGWLGWRCWTGSPGGGTNLPARLTVQLRHAIGPLEKTQEIRPAFTGTMSLEGNSILNGLGQDAKGNAFVAIAVNTEEMKGRAFGAVAVAKDGRETRHSGSGRGVSDVPGVSVAKFEFPILLSSVDKFIIGTRPIRTNEWKNIVLPGN